jgi:hypothetical protein
MQTKNYKIIIDGSLVYADLATDSAILKDYYFVNNNLDQNNLDFYSDKDISLILSLTDTEFVDYINQYKNLGLEDSASNGEDSKKLQDELDSLENQINESKKIENGIKEYERIEKELVAIKQNLSSYENLIERINEAKDKLDQYKNFRNLDTNKIHADLININNQIDRLEENLIDRKMVEMKTGKVEYEIEEGRWGLIWGAAIAFGILGVVGSILSLPNVFVVGSWVLGFFICLFLYLTRKSKVSRDLFENNQSSDYINKQILDLKSHRDSILALVNMRSSKEFFLQKANYSSIKKNYDFMVKQSESLRNDLCIDKIREEKNDLEEKVSEFSEYLDRKNEILPADKYLELYRGIDELKLKLGSTPKKNLSKDEILQKLISIKNELKAKLPQYVNILKDTFSRQFEAISQNYNHFIETTGLQAEKLPAEFFELSKHNNFEKSLAQLSIAKTIYNNFVFIIPDSKKWQIEQQEKLNQFINNYRNNDFEMVLVDEN